MTLTLQFYMVVLSNLDLRVILKHIFGWCIFIAYETLFVWLSTGTNFPFFDYIFYYSLNILLFYANAHLVLEHTIASSKKYVLIPGLMLVEMVVYLIIKYILDYFLAAKHHAFTSQLIYINRFLVLNIFRGIYFIGFSTLYWSIMRTIFVSRKAHETETAQLTTLKQKAEVERNLAEAMNAYLQVQINPHLLFNTLTFIHNTYYKHSQDASQCVLLLADIMRFSLEEVNVNGKISLDKEIDQIRNFIELNQLRFDYDLHIDFQSEGDFERIEVIPLILLTLTENIFKHGYLKKKTEQAKLHISVNNQYELTFHSWNLKRHETGHKRRRSIGIKNVIKRLDYAYQNQYKLIINDEEDSYELELRIHL